MYAHTIVGKSLGWGLLALAGCLLCQTAYAGSPSITGAAISGNQITITGSNLYVPIITPKVYLDGIQLGVAQFSATQIVANGASNVGAGSYLLMVDNGSGQGTFDVTNGTFLLPFSGTVFMNQPAPAFSVSNSSIGSAATGLQATGGYGSSVDGAGTGLLGVGGPSGGAIWPFGGVGFAGGGSGVEGDGGNAAGSGDTAGTGGYFVGGSGGSSTRSYYGGDGVDAIGGSGPAGGGFGIVAIGDQYAGVFWGDVQISGNVSKGGGSFEIDHPLDPANKYLYHSFVESPDMMNIYAGNVVTDARGHASVILPDWFEALNRDFTYQLTVVGQYAEAWIASEIAGHTFAIQTGKPNVKVSWQVTGVRQDAWANAHRIPVEVAKVPADQGHYLHPELFGHADEPSILELHHPRAAAARRKNQ